MKGMDMTKKIIIALMVSCSGLQAMMIIRTKDDAPVVKSTLTKDTSVVKSVQTQGMPMIFPKAFIEASPILSNIEKEPEFRRLKLRGLFEDQPTRVVLRVIEYQEALCSKEALTIECMKSIEYAYDIALIKRLGLNALLAEYLKLVPPPGS